jgi:hypothetical protein
MQARRLQANQWTLLQKINKLARHACSRAGTRNTKKEKLNKNLKESLTK